MRREPRETPTAAAYVPATESVPSDDLLPPAYHEARLCFRQGRIDNALVQLDLIFTKTGRPVDGLETTVLREPVLLRAWCLIEQKRPGDARNWLDLARGRGHLATDDVTAQIIDLNARLYEEDFAGIQLSYWASAKDGFNIEVDYTDLNHEDPDLWYDYTSLTAGAGWLHQLSEILVMNLAYRHSEFQPQENLFFDNEFRQSKSDEITVGFRGMVSPVIKTEIVVGYRKTSYNVPGEASEIIPDFTGFIMKGYFNWDLGHGSALRLDLLRSDYPSNFGINANYVATGASLQYQYQYNRFSAQIRGRYQVNDYAVRDLLTGEDRKDPISTIGLGLGYRFGPYISLWGGYLYENRDSTLERYGYNYNVFTLGLIIGY